MTTDRLDLASPDLVTQNIDKIALLFPHCVTETDKGKAIDFDLLKQELNHQTVEGNKERYRLEWPGKREAIVTANMATTNTLRPIREDSVDFDTTENLYIEGDNFEVLKLLQESYLGKIKMIYIDPPYNTGNDFVYKDNFTQNTEDFKQDSGLVDEYNQRLVPNPETAGRYHSDWLSMMYPRLKLARNLLTDDGVIFISIDDNEVHNLRKMCDEIFGEGNFVANVIWERAYSPVNLKKHFSENHDFVLCYSKSLELTTNNGLKRSSEANNRYSNPDNDSRGVWKSSDFSVGPPIQDNIYEIITPSCRPVLPPSGRSWVLNKVRYKEFLDDNRIWFGVNGDATPSIKRFLSEVKEGITPMTIWRYSEVGHSQEAAQSLKKLFDGSAFFDYPKPLGLINRCLELYSNQDSIILDFFSGSATTAHAAMQLNAEGGGMRKFIMVQVPEATDPKSEAHKAGYFNICEIGKERIRRAGKKIKEEQAAKQKKKDGEIKFEDEIIQPIDTGFRVYRLDSSNMEEVYYKPDEYKQEALDLFADNIKPDRSPEDLLTQIILDMGLPLSLKIEEIKILEKTVYKVSDNALFVCFDTGIESDFAREIAKQKPERIVFRDSTFKDDTAKENVKQLLKQLSPNTQMRII